jgi:hypothetical protein
MALAFLQTGAGDQTPVVHVEDAGAAPPEPTEAPREFRHTPW